MSIEHYFIFLLISGLLLIGAEVFVPGGILGIAGGMALLGAIVTGFIAFPEYGMLIAVGIIFLAGVAVVIWIKVFPKTPLGKAMTVSADMSEAVATEDGLDELLGKHGMTSSELRPAGFALIDGRRVDVITLGEMISSGKSVIVVEVEGNRVVVAESDHQVAVKVEE
jgi:membrane-bound serine protease (ClpP class)